MLTREYFINASWWLGFWCTRLGCWYNSHQLIPLHYKPPTASISWVPCINLPLHRIHSSWLSDISDPGIRLWCRVSSPTAAQPWIWGPCPFIKQLDHIKFSFSQWAELWACLLSQCNASVSCPPSPPPKQYSVQYLKSSHSLFHAYTCTLTFCISEWICQ